MPTSSERGIPIKDETTFWWVWSVHGETDSGIYYDRMFVKGMVPLPLPGDIASELEYRGYCLTEYVPGEWFSRWERDEGHAFHQHPVFAPLETKTAPVAVETNSDEFPPIPQVMPPRLPQEWVDFLSHYTNGGKLKKEFRSDGS